MDLDYLHEDGERSATWPAGLHFPYPPWYQVSFLVTKQSVIFDVPVKACKTRDNVTVDIAAGVTFRIMGDASIGEDSYLVRKFVYELQPSGLEQQLRGAHEAVMRSLVKNLDHTSIYGIRNQEIIEEQTSVIEGGENRSLEVSGFVSGSSTSYSASYEPRTPQRVISRDMEAIGTIQSSDENVSETIKEALNDQFV